MIKSIILCSLLLTSLITAAEYLPQSLTFIGKDKYVAIMDKATKQRWHKLAIGDRMANIALQLESIPYKGHTLEIHDHTESASVNFNGLDCWTFFEAVLCMARIMEDTKTPHTTSKLLKEIENSGMGELVHLIKSSEKLWQLHFATFFAFSFLLKCRANMGSLSKLIDRDAIPKHQNCLYIQHIPLFLRPERNGHVFALV